MKTIIVATCIILLIANSILSYVINSYNEFNLLVSSAVIILNSSLIFAIFSFGIKDGLKIPLLIFYFMIGFATFILSLFFELPFKDNLVFIIGFILIGIQLLLFTISVIFSREI